MTRVERARLQAALDALMPANMDDWRAPIDPRQLTDSEFVDFVANSLRTTADGAQLVAELAGAIERRERTSRATAKRISDRKKVRRVVLAYHAQGLEAPQIVGRLPGKMSRSLRTVERIIKLG
jgi:hypothetical protein